MQILDQHSLFELPTDETFEVELWHEKNLRRLGRVCRLTMPQIDAYNANFRNTMPWIQFRPVKTPGRTYTIQN